MKLLYQKILILILIIKTTLQNNENTEEKSELDKHLDDLENEDLSSQYNSHFHPELIEIPEKLSHKYLSQNITDFHLHIKGCIEVHFTANPKDQISLDLIIDDCVGDKGEKLLRYYNDIKFLMKKFLMKEIQDKLFTGSCDDNILYCIDFYKEIQLFMELDYEIKNSMNENYEVMELLVGKEKVDFFFFISSEVISDYKVLKDELRGHQLFLVHFIKLKRHQYTQDYPAEEEVEEEEGEVGGANNADLISNSEEDNSEENITPNKGEEEIAENDEDSGESRDDLKEQNQIGGKN